MFYQTKVKSITPSGIIDTSGRKLSFVGNKLVRANDFVWTDGKVVFGHTPIRGGNVLLQQTDDEMGIPVLCDDIQGYFDMRGEFHEEILPVTGLFVNDSKNYYQPPNISSPYRNDVLLDAEILVDENGKSRGAIFLYRVGYFSDTLGIYAQSNFIVYKSDSTKLSEIPFTKEITNAAGNTILVADPTTRYGGTLPIYNFLKETGEQMHIIYASREELREEFFLPFEGNGAWIYCTVQDILSEQKLYLYQDTNIKATLFTRTGAYRLQHGVPPEEYRELVLPYAYGATPFVITVNFDGVLPLQDGFQIKYTEKVPIIEDNELNFSGAYFHSYGPGQKFQLLGSYSGNNSFMFPFYTNKFSILNKNGNAILDVDFPARTINPVNISIIKLSGERYLLSLPIYKAYHSSAESCNGIYLYDKKNGLRRVIDSCCLNTRLRPMRNVLKAKVIS